MNSDRLHNLIFLLCILVCCVATSANAAGRWALRVVSIEMDGRASDTVSEVPIIAPGQDRAEKRVLKKGTTIAQGVEIVVPRRTVLVLESASGNQIRLQPGSRFKVQVVGSEGETYTLLLGQAVFKVTRALNFFNVNYQSFLAIVRGTEFDMEVEPEKEIRFRLTEGRLVVQREVKVKILDGDKVVQLTASDILAKGKKTEVSYRLGVEEYLKEFKTFKDAEGYFRRQLEEDEKSGQYEYERIQQGLNNLGLILDTIGKPREALGNYERALKAARERRDERWEAVLLNNLGVAWRQLGDAKKAIEYYEKALEIDRKVYGEQHPSVATDYNNLGAAWDNLAEHKKAIEYYEKALEIDRKAYGEQHPSVATDYNNLGVAWRQLGDAKKAIEYYEKALEIDRKVYGEQHPKVAIRYNNLGVAWRQLGDAKKAIEYYEKALEIYIKFNPDGIHANILQSYRNLSSAYRAAGEPARSDEYAKKGDEVEAKLKRSSVK